MNRMTQQAHCRTCGWESPQPDELQRADALRHSAEFSGHKVELKTTTVEEIGR